MIEYILIFLTAVCVVFALGLLLLAALQTIQTYRDRQQVRSDIVVRKQFIPDHNETILVTTWVGKTPMTVPQNIHYPDAWTITIEGHSNLQGEKKTVTHEVSEQQFNDAAVGEFWCADG